jgi:hypothetical protein
MQPESSDIFVNENENENYWLSFTRTRKKNKKNFKNENGIRTVIIVFKRTKIIASPRGPKAAMPNVIRSITLRSSRTVTVPSLRCKSGSLFGIDSLDANGNDY